MVRHTNDYYGLKEKQTKNDDANKAYHKTSKTPVDGKEAVWRPMSSHVPQSLQ